MTHKITRRNFISKSSGAALLVGCGIGEERGTIRGETLVREHDTRPPYGGRLAFEHGIASGDPTQTTMVIWTRVTPKDLAGDVIPVSYGVYRDEALTDPVVFGLTTAEQFRDYCVKIEIKELEPGTTYYYHFTAKAVDQDLPSPVGRAKTLPNKANVFTVAAVSCSHYGFGYFNAYNALAQDNSVDLVLHLGDYIYEYGPMGYGGETGTRLDRTPIPPAEITTLDDYRARYAQYRSDPDLQAVHAAHPFICNWDDHESANDSWAGGAENHSAEQGNWAERKQAAIRAYLDWMPIREPENLSLDGLIYRSFDIADIATLICIETRLTGRSPKLSWEETLKGVESDQMRAETDAMMNRVLDENRTMLGPRQEAWVDTQIERSVREGKAWQILANQTLMAPAQLPNFMQIMTENEIATHPESVVKLMAPFSQLNLPYNLDAWDGFPKARERLFTTIADQNAHLLTLTGDSHTAWVNTLVDKTGKTLGVEFATTSITSPGMGSYFENIPDLGAEFVAANDSVKWHKANGHGYCRVTLTKTHAKGDFIEVSNILSRDFSIHHVQTAKVNRFKLNEIELI